MNGGAPPRNQATMASRPLVWLALSLLPMSVGCGTTSADTPAATPVAAAAPVAAAPARFTVRVLNHLAWPYRLRRVVVVSDGALVYDMRIAKDREPPAEHRMVHSRVRGGHRGREQPDQQRSLERGQQPLGVQRAQSVRQSDVDHDRQQDDEQGLPERQSLLDPRAHARQTRTSCGQARSSSALPAASP